MTTPEVSAAQQFQMSNAFDPQQMQQMSAMMAMAAAGMAGGAPTGAMGVPGAPAAPLPGTGMPNVNGAPLMPPTTAPTAPGTAAVVADGAPSFPNVDPAMTQVMPDGSAPPFPTVDPAMTQAYATMFAQYLQQAQAYAGMGADPNAMNGTMGMPPAPFPPVTPYPATQPLMPTSPVVSVSVEGMKFQYQLTEDDLHKVFSRYGTVKEIRVEEVGTMAQITFENVQYAQAAMNDLNGKVLNGLEGTLRINWLHTAGGGAGPPPAATAMPPPYPMMPPPFPGWGFPPTAPSWPTTPAAGLGGLNLPLDPSISSPGSLHLNLNNVAPTAPAPPATPPPSTGGGSTFSPGTETKAPAHVKGVRKYTCRFLIGISNDKDFQVVRRIIGAKGAHMKKIVKATEAKLRLRGEGSGYFEGAGQKESTEPLQLCVSCTSAEGYRNAVKLVEELMQSVYDDYRAYCRELGRPEPDLHPTPQLVSSGRDRGGGDFGIDFEGMMSSPGSPEAEGLMGDEGDAIGDKKSGRRRGRRSRAKKGDASKASERGDPPSRAPPVEEIETMIDQRNEARRQCNFAEADRIRQSLHERGVALMDEPGGRGKANEVTTWRYWRE